MVDAIISGKLGTELLPEEQREVLARYVYRHTRDHVPAWVRLGEWEPGKPYPVQFASDAEWLATTRFPVTRNGRLAARGDCYSRPTWPDNPELRPAPHA